MLINTLYTVLAQHIAQIYALICLTNLIQHVVQILTSSPTELIHLNYYLYGLDLQTVKYRFRLGYAKIWI